MSTEINLLDPNIEYKYEPNPNVHELTLDAGDHVIELEYHFTVPIGAQRKLKIIAVLLGIDE